MSSAQNGEPQALYDSKGELRWQVPKATLWGQRAVAKTESSDPGLAFAGQLRDSESGLCYNRFRYYDPTGGGYISPDPIGVLGGESNYAYVHNPNTWVDPLGLAKCQLAKSGEDLYVGTYSQVRGANIKSGLNPTHTPHHAIQNAASPTTHGRGITINMRKDLHELTWTYKKPMVRGLSNREYLARDIVDLRKILGNAGYSRDVINRQLGELIRQNKELWKTLGQ
ncbi:hypothetical protein AU510_17465 [Lonsdalea britannica]|nr:hypothetical protein AU510_17465 [Lonsdalea britannica]